MDRNIFVTYCQCMLNCLGRKYTEFNKVVFWIGLSYRKFKLPEQMDNGTSYLEKQRPGAFDQKPPDQDSLILNLLC